MSQPFLLYNLPCVIDADVVYVTEGEKAADAICKVGLTATTSPHGASSAHKADWSPLAGKKVILLPDCDAAGERYMQDVIKQLSRISPAPQVKLFHLPDLTKGEDAYEFVHKHYKGNFDRARNAILWYGRKAQDVSMDQPVSSIDEYQSFPTSLLPSPIDEYIRTCAKSIGCDESFIALPLLSALGAAIGNSLVVRLKEGWEEPAIVWTCLVGDSGSAKTPAIKQALRSLRSRQSTAFKQHKESMEEYRKDLAQWKKNGRDSPEPMEPKAERYVANDITIEALIELLRQNPRGLLSYHDELSGWIHGFDKYRDGGRGGADAAQWLEIHQANALYVDRKSTGTTHVDRAFVCVTGGIQSELLKRCLSGQYLENGLAARLLMVYPPLRRRVWTDAAIPAELQERIDSLFSSIFKIRPDDSDPDAIVPRWLGLTDKALKHWIEFFNEHGREQGELANHLASAWAKLEGYAARFALILHTIKHAQELRRRDRKISENTMKAAIQLTAYFKRETIRSYRLLIESDRERDQRRMVEWISRRGGSVTPREVVHQYRHVEDIAAAENLLNDLFTAGFGTWYFPKPKTKGGRPTKRFGLHKALRLNGNSGAD